MTDKSHFQGIKWGSNKSLPNKTSLKKVWKKQKERKKEVSPSHLYSKLATQILHKLTIGHLKHVDLQFLYKITVPFFW